MTLNVTDNITALTTYYLARSTFEYKGKAEI